MPCSTHTCRLTSTPVSVSSPHSDKFRWLKLEFLCKAATPCETINNTHAFCCENLSNRVDIYTLLIPPLIVVNYIIHSVFQCTHILSVFATINACIMLPKPEKKTIWRVKTEAKESYAHTYIRTVEVAVKNLFTPGFNVAHLISDVTPTDVQMHNGLHLTQQLHTSICDVFTVAEASICYLCTPV